MARVSANRAARASHVGGAVRQFAAPLFLLFASATAAFPEFREVLPNGDAGLLPQLQWTQRIAGTANDYYFDAIVKPEPTLGGAAAPLVTNVFKGRTTQHRFLTFGGQSGRLNRDVWQYNGGMYNHSLNIFEDEYGTCDVEEVGSTCNTWSRQNYDVTVPWCEEASSTCRTRTLSSADGDIAELARKDHIISPIYESVKLADAQGNMILAFGGKNYVRFMNDIRAYSGTKGVMSCPRIAFEDSRARRPSCHGAPQIINVTASDSRVLDSGVPGYGQRCYQRVTTSSAKGVPAVDLVKLDVLAHYGCQNRFRLLDVPAAAADPEAEGTLLLDTCRNKPEGESVEGALDRARVPRCGRLVTASAPGRDLLLILEINEYCPGFGGFQGTAHLATEPIRANVSQCSRTYDVPGTYRLAPEPRSEHTSVVVPTRSASVVERVLNFTLPSRFTFPSPEESAQALADLTEVKDQAVRTGVALKSGNRYKRRDNLPPEIQSFVCKKGTTEPDRCFKLIYDGEETESIAPIAHKSVIKARLEALPNVNEVSVVIIPSKPRVAGEGGGCYMQGYFTPQESTDNGCNAEEYAKAEACVLLTSGAPDSFYNFINVTFVNTTACDSSARECDLSPVELEWVFEETADGNGNCAPVDKDYTGFNGVLGLTDVNKGSFEEGRMGEVFKGVEPYNLTFIDENTTAYERDLNQNPVILVKEPYTSMTVEVQEFITETTQITVNKTKLITDHVVNITTTTAVSAGDMRMLVFGGWVGDTTADSTVWAFDWARQLNETVRGASKNYDPEIHPVFPVLRPISIWEPLPVAGPQPPARYSHSAARVGVSGGRGAERLSMLVFGGRTKGGRYMNDTWELSVEDQEAFHSFALEVVVTCPMGSNTTAFNHTLFLLNETVSFNSQTTYQELVDAVLALPGAGPVPNNTVMERLVKADGGLVVCGAEPRPQDIRVNSTIQGRPFPILIHAPAVTSIRSDLRSLPLNVSLSLVRNEAFQGANVSTIGTMLEDTLYNDTRYAVMDLRPVVVWEPQEAYRWRSLAPAAKSTGSPSPRVSAAMETFAATWGSSITVLYGGWDSLTVYNDVWRAQRLSERGLIAWTKLRDPGNGKWLSCRPYFYPISWYGLACSQNDDGDTPMRYLHRAVPITISSNGSMGLAFLGGTSLSRLPVGNNSNIYGLPTGGADPDLFVLCDVTDKACGELFKTDPAATTALPRGAAVAVFIALVAARLLQ